VEHQISGHLIIIFSTSPTGSENHISPLRFQTFNRKVFWNRNEARWFSDPVGEVLILDNNADCIRSCASNGNPNDKNDF